MIILPGITKVDNFAHHFKEQMGIVISSRLKRGLGNIVKRTINSNGNSLIQNEAIGTDKGGDLAQGVDLEVIGTLVGLSVHQLEIQAVSLGHNEDRDGARVLLWYEGSISLVCFNLLG